MITPSQSVKELLVSLAAYPSGDGELLYAVHALDRIDKHRTILPTAHISHMNSFLLVDLATKERVPTGSFYGLAEGGPIFTAPKGFGIDVKSHTYPTPEIFFPEVDVVPNEPVLPTLLHMLESVQGAVKKMKGLTVTG